MEDEPIVEVTETEAILSPRSQPVGESPKQILINVARNFDLNDPLKFISQQLCFDAEKNNRPYDLSDMSITEKKAEKLFVKTQLRAFDYAFNVKFGRMVIYFLYFVLFIYFFLFLAWKKR